MSAGKREPSMKVDFGICNYIYLATVVNKIKQMRALVLLGGSHLLCLEKKTRRMRKIQ